MSGKFIFDSKTRTDHTGSSALWMKRVRHGIIASISLGIAHAAHAAPSDPVVQRMATHVMTQIVGDGSISHPGASAFDADAKNQVADPSLDEAKKNTVLIMYYTTTDEDRRFTAETNGVGGHGAGIEIGTGTVIADSAIIDRNGTSHPNAILTAGHVIGIEPGVPVRGDPCAMSGRRCVAFSEDGRPLGRLTLRAKSLPDLDSAGDDMTKAIAHDVVSLNVEPFDDRFNRIKGIELAEQIPHHAFRVEVSGAYSSETGREMPNIGASPGFSGGGAYSLDGRLSGVLTYALNLHTSSGKTSFYNTANMQKIMSVNTGKNFNVNMLSVASHIHGQEEMTRIPSSEMEMFGKNITDSGEFWPRDSLIVSPISSDVLASLGSAGQNSYHHHMPDQNESLFIVGNPVAQPLSMRVQVHREATIDKMLRPTISSQSVDEKETPVIGEDGKPAIAQPASNLSPAL